LNQEKNALIIEENHIDQQRRAFQAKQRALIYKEKVQTERNTLQNDLNTSHTDNRFRSSSHIDKFRSSIKADENFIYNNVLKTENKGLDSRKHTAEFKTENKGSDSRRNTADRHTADIHKNNGGVMNFKLSQKTFKKIVLDKQHEQKILNLQIEGRNAALKKNEFNNSDLLSIDSNILHTKGSQKFLNDLSLSGQNKINKGFFVNRDM
jgi:ribosomal protein L25 (general stress protein Ctc)